MKRILLLLISIVLLSNLSCQLLKYKQAIKKLKIENIDLSKVKDGIYEGFCDVYLVNARVKITVKNHKITDIDLIEHKHGKGYGADQMTGKVINKQSLEVDTITGATGSSKVILKAIEEALKKGIE